MQLTKRLLITSGILFVLSQLFFLIYIQFPRTPNFDEAHYIPSAKQFLEMNHVRNLEHPPLGKLLMAGGIAVFGDRPIGWRFMSTVFGALTLVGIYVLAIVLFNGNEGLALWVALLTLSNHLLYVQSRIGMLDTFMTAFLVWALVGFCAAWRPGLSTKQIRNLMAFAGACFGFALACKWFAFIPWMACCGLICAVKVLQTWEVSFAHPKNEDWFRPNLWLKIPTRTWLLTLGAVPLATYFITFLPYLFVTDADYGLWDLVKMQYQMWDGQLRVVNSHPYMSQWMDWPLLTRPIWYAFDREGANPESVRGVLLLGNPLVMWTGLLALGICLWGWIRERSRVAFFVLFFYSIFYFSWPFIPRRVAFYYYYYPSGLMLSFALAYAFQFLEESKKWRWARWVYLGAAFGVFLHFFPILAAVRIPLESFRQWMWFRSWI